MVRIQGQQQQNNQGDIETHDPDGTPLSPSYVWIQRFRRVKNQWGWLMFKVVDDDMARMPNAPTTVLGAPHDVNLLLQEYIQMNPVEKESVHVLMFRELRDVPRPTAGRRKRRATKKAGRRGLHRKTGRKTRRA